MAVRDSIPSNAPTGSWSSAWIPPVSNTSNHFHLRLMGDVSAVKRPAGRLSGVTGWSILPYEATCALSDHDASTSRASAPATAELPAGGLGVEPTLDEMLVGIRTRLGLNITQLAEVLRVERPTVYSWLKSTGEIRSGNRQRIRDIWKVALDWGNVCEEPLKADLDREVGGGQTIRELLRDEHLRFFVLRQAFRRLAAERRSPVSPRRGRRGRDFARRRGERELPAAEAIISRETGQRAMDDE